jgi:hypothetical protein
MQFVFAPQPKKKRKSWQQKNEPPRKRPKKPRTPKKTNNLYNHVLQKQPVVSRDVMR